MKKATLKTIVLEQAQQLDKQVEFSAREVMSAVPPVLKLPHAIVIMGLRRSGKSTLQNQIMRQYYPDDAYYLSFEDERLMDFTVADFNLLYEVFLELYGERRCFCFDEIQNVPEWERFVRRLYEQKKFILTGSNASLLSQELGTRLTGRHISLELFPFSFREYLLFKGIHYDEKSFQLTDKRAEIYSAFCEYTKMGGIPEYVMYENPLTLTSLYDNLLYKDIIVRYDVKDVHALRELALYCMSNPGTLISNSKLKNTLNLGSVNTVKNYLHYFENTYLIITLGRYAPSLKSQMSTQKKVYAIDTGLIETIGFQVSQNVGRYLENMVLLELRRRKKEIYYYKTENNQEVDFLIREGRRITQLIQVAQQIDDPDTQQREISALLTAMAELRVDQGLLLVLDFPESTAQIKVQSITEWLLMG